MIPMDGINPLYQQASQVVIPLLITALILKEMVRGYLGRPAFKKIDWVLTAACVLLLLLFGYISVLQLAQMVSTT